MTTLSPELIKINERIKAFDAKRKQDQAKQTAPQTKARPEIKIETSINQHGALVGDILCSTWGYEQTNYDFYKVIKTTQKTITLEKLNGFDKGSILKNKKTKCYMQDGSEYLVNLNSYSNAKCRINDRYAKGMYKSAQEELENPYRSEH